MAFKIGSILLLIILLPFVSSVMEVDLAELGSNNTFWTDQVINQYIGIQNGTDANLLNLSVGDLSASNWGSQFGNGSNQYWKIAPLCIEPYGCYATLESYSDGALGNIGVIRNGLYIVDKPSVTIRNPTLTLIEEDAYTSASIFWDGTTIGMTQPLTVTGNIEAAGGDVSGSSISIGSAILEVSEWTYLDGLDQALKKSDSVTFKNINGSSLNISGGAMIQSLNVTSSLTISSNKVNISSSGDVNATKFYGDGSGLTGITATDGTKIANGTDASLKSLNVSTLNVTGGAQIGGGLNVSEGAILFNGTKGATPTSGEGTKLMWIPSKSAFRAGYVDGAQWDDENIGSYSFATGHKTIASGDWSMATGYESNATDVLAFAMGYRTVASGYYSTSIGYKTIASGSQSVAIGNVNKASGQLSTSIGYKTIASGSQSVAIGRDIDCTQTNAICLGTGNVGIGMSAPSTNLDVNGSTRTNNLNVTGGAVISALNITGKLVAGNISSAGDINATKFYGDGSGLTSVTGTDGTKIANATDASLVNLNASSLNVTGGVQIVGGLNVSGNVGIKATALLVPEKLLVGDGAGTTASWIGIDAPNNRASGIRLYEAGVYRWAVAKAATTSGFAIYNYDSASYPFLIDNSTNNIGISTTSPLFRLHINGSVMINGTPDNNTLYIGDWKVNISGSGDVNATKFYGDGSGLTGITATDGTKIANGTDASLKSINVSSLNMTGNITMANMMMIVFKDVAGNIDNTSIYRAAGNALRTHYGHSYIIQSINNHDLRFLSSSNAILFRMNFTDNIGRVIINGGTIDSAKQNLIVVGDVNITTNLFTGDYKVNISGSGDVNATSLYVSNSYSTQTAIGYGIYTPSTQLDVINEGSGAIARGITSSLHSNAAASSLIIGRKSRGTNAVPLRVNASDNILGIWARPYNGSDYIWGGAIGFAVNSSNPVFDDRIPLDMIFTLNNGTSAIGLTTAGSERMRLTNKGNLGIGKLPNYMLDVNGDVNATDFRSRGGTGITASGTSCTITEIKGGIITGATCT